MKPSSIASDIPDASPSALHSPFQKRSPISLSEAEAEQIADDLALEMRASWRSGNPRDAASYLSSRSELCSHPRAAVRVVFEEFCLRQASGEDAGDSLVAQFPQWSNPLGVMFSCQRHLFIAEADRPRMPECGETVGDFQLRTEMGRGARGRVFLATQVALSHRPVVVKITPLDGKEHLCLARVQHTNIVPLYSMLDDMTRNIRLLCMPYFGRATLAMVLRELLPMPVEQRSGHSILHAVDALQGESLLVDAPPAAARQMLASVSYVEALTWIIACLADALQFAHERGLMHLDLKPSNILLSIDGQPMLLDFHLAREQAPADTNATDYVGGTPGYMPPEQQRAVEAMQRGTAVGPTVDKRADIYALGVIFFEALGGRMPDAGVRLSSLNAQVSTGLSDIVAKCLAPHARDRYADARTLADDLRRHLNGQPLAGVRNRSIRERWRKRQQRQPHFLRVMTMGAVATLAVVILIASFYARFHERHEQAEVALNDGHRQMAHPRTRAEAIKSFTRGLDLIAHQPLEDELRGQLQADLLITQRLQLADQVHSLADDLRLVYGLQADSQHPVAALISRCEALWAHRLTLMENTPAAERSALSADLLDIAIVAARLNLLNAPGSDRKVPGHRRTVAIFDEAEQLFGTNPVLTLERSLNAAPASSPPSTAMFAGNFTGESVWEQCALGRAHLFSGDLSKAADHLRAGLEQDPVSLWANFYYALCSSRQGNHVDAIAALSVAIGFSPKSAALYYNRAASYTALDRDVEALRDYDRALELEPTFALCALNRGMLNFKKERWREAGDDLKRALVNGADPAVTHYDLALVCVASNDTAAAIAHLHDALAFTPTHALATELLATLTRAGKRPNDSTIYQPQMSTDKLR